MIEFKLDKNDFYTVKKDSYTFDDMQKILDEAYKAASSKLEVQVKKITEQIEAETQNKLNAFNLLEDKNKDMSSQIQKQVDDIKTKEELISQLEAQIKPLQDSHNNQLAQKIFKGVVIDGAEMDVFDLVKDNDEFKKINFESETWQQNLQPILTEVFKTKPYLKVAEKKAGNQKSYQKPVYESNNKFVNKFDNETEVNKEFKAIIQQGEKELHIDKENNIII